MAGDSRWMWPVRACFFAALVRALVGLTADSGAAVDLSQNSFESFLDELPPSVTVLMEYYAHWCALALPFSSSNHCAWLQPLIFPLSLAHFSTQFGRDPRFESASQIFSLLRCPSCQAFQPTYEKIAVFFNAEPRPQPEVVVARVDCAVEASTRF